MNRQVLKSDTLRKQLTDWFATALGERVQQIELEQMQDILPRLFGYHILQFGYPNKFNYLAASKIVNKTILCLDTCELDAAEKTIGCSAESLPIATDSIDVVVLPHVLEFSKDPHQLLREVDRILIDDGHVVIIGINRFSLWGLWHLFLCWWNKVPWSGKLISIHRLKDWLSLLDFDVKNVHYSFYAPPLKNQKLLDKCLPLERLGRYCWPIFGGLYVITGNKRVVPLNPIKMQWRAERRLLGSGVVEPTTRNTISKHG